MMLVDAPARQNASVMHTTISSRSNAGGGWFNRALVISRCPPVFQAPCSFRFRAFEFSSSAGPTDKYGELPKVAVVQRNFKISLS